MKVINDIQDRNKTDGLIKAVIAEAEALVTSLKALRKSTQLNIGSWAVYESDGYFKATQRIAGKICSVHLGRVFDRELATQKIRTWEAGHLVADPPMDEPANLPIDQPVDEPVDLVADQPMEEPANLPIDQPVEEPGNLVADQPVDIRECRMLINNPVPCPDEGGEK
jgi:hypothetical protein